MGWVGALGCCEGVVFACVSLFWVAHLFFQCTPTQLLRTALLVDIGLPVPAFLPNINIPDSIPLEVRVVLGKRMGGWVGRICP